MAEKNSKPEIRFKGFSEEWEKRKLGTIAEFNPKAELPEIFEYVDLESVVGTEMVTHREERKDTAPSRAQRLARKGDLFYQTVRPYQKNNHLFDKNCKNYVFSTGYAQMRPHGDGYFLLSLIQNNGFVKTVLDNCTGTSYPAINSNNLAELDVYIPAKNIEQTHIGTFFTHLDHLITLHQRKYNKLVTVKKAMLEKIFPQNGAVVPEIRFKGFTEAWEVLELGKTKTFFTDGNYGEAYPEATDLTDSASGIPFLRGSNLSEGQLTKYGANYITKEKHCELTSGHLIEDDIVLAVRGSLGALGYVKSENVGWNINSQLAIIRTEKKELRGNFLIQYLLSDRGQRELFSKITGTALKQLPIGQLKQVVILITDIEEQCKIGTFFKKLDNLITLQQRELEKLKNIKKACLEKMFV